VSSATTSKCSAIQKKTRTPTRPLSTDYFATDRKVAAEEALAQTKFTTVHVVLHFFRRRRRKKKDGASERKKKMEVTEE